MTHYFRPRWFIALLLIAASGHSFGQVRARPTDSVAYARVLLPYLGGSIFEGPGLQTELTAQNTSDRPVAYRFDPGPCVLPEGCPTSLPPAMLFVTRNFSPAFASRGGILRIEATAADAIRIALRICGPNAQEPEVPVEGPEVPLARERDFRKAQRIICVPNHLDTSIRVYALDGAPTVKIGMYSVEFGKDTLLESFDLDLPQAGFDLPSFAERDLTTALSALDTEIPQSRIAFRIEAATPVWAMILQRDSNQHIVTFVTAQ